MMKIILRLAHLFDNKKDRAYVSEAGKFLNTNIKSIIIDEIAIDSSQLLKLLEVF